VTKPPPITPKNNHLKDTIMAVREALSQWEGISSTVETDQEAFRKKTRELLIKLSEQIQALDL
jgi:hypothetical protein